MEQPTGNDHSLEQLVGLVTLAIVIILVIIFWLIKPQVSTLKDINAQVSAKKQELTATEEKLASMNALSKEITSKKEVVDKLNIVLPFNNPEIADIILELNNIASKSTVELKSIVPTNNLTGLSSSAESSETADSETLNVATYELNFSITGSYDGIKDFFTNIEKNLKSFKVKAVNITSSGNNDPILSASIIADTYYQQVSSSSQSSAESSGNFE